MTPELCTCVGRGEQGGREYCKHMDQDKYRWKETSKTRMNQKANVSVVQRRNSWIKMRCRSGPEQGGPSRSS